MSVKSTRFVTSTRNRSHIKTGDGLSIVLLCADMGVRMKSYGPKSLLTLPDGDRVIDKAIENISMVFPKCEIVVVVGFQAQKVIDYLPRTVHIVENPVFDSTNDAENMRLGLNATTNENVLMIHGDVLFNRFALDRMGKGESKILVDNKDQMPEDSAGVTVVDGKASILSYGLDTRWSHMVFFAKNETELLNKVLKNRAKANLFSFEIINNVIDMGGTFLANEPKNVEVGRIYGSKDWKVINEGTNL